uniref:Uncharacterized protein n=1 Tax=Oryza meridionalis TaxID=40149 RepID=A0A0E0BXP0_9ORYZ
MQIRGNGILEFVSASSVELDFFRMQTRSLQLGVQSSSTCFPCCKGNATQGTSDASMASSSMKLSRYSLVPFNLNLVGEIWGWN